MENIEKMVVRLEERVDNMNGKLSEVDKTVAVFASLVERNLLVQEKLSASIDLLSTASSEMKLAMTQMQGEIRTVVIEIGEVKKETQSLKTAISEVESKTKTKIQEVDDKGKIDWIILAKQGITSLLMGGGLWAIILYILERLK